MFVEERIALGHRKTLMLVNCAGRRFLLVEGDSITPPVDVQSIGWSAGSADGSSLEQGCGVL